MICIFPLLFLIMLWLHVCIPRVMFFDVFPMSDRSLSTPDFKDGTIKITVYTYT